MERNNKYSLGKMLSYDPIKGQGVAEITAYSTTEVGFHSVFINSKYANFIWNILFIKIATIPTSQQILEENINDIKYTAEELQQIDSIKNIKPQDDMRVYKVELSAEYETIYKPGHSK